MSVALRRQSRRGELPYVIEPRAIEGRSKKFAKIKCDHADCGVTAEIHVDAAGSILPTVAINKKFASLGWYVKRHHNLCPKHNGKAPRERKVLTLASVPKRFQEPMVSDPAAAVQDVAPIRAAPSLSHVHESKVESLSPEHQLVWYRQALERERKRNDTLRKERISFFNTLKPIAEQARQQFIGLGDVWSSEVSWADRRGVVLSINFEHLKNAVRAVDGKS
jgi:hypothetical protein